MAIQIEFYFDFASPYSYLAATQLPALTAGTGAEIVYRPFRLLELMKIVGNRPTTIECKNKGNYAGADIARWATRYKVPFQRNPNRRNFDYAALGRGALVAIDEGRGANYVDVVFRAICAGEQDLSDRRRDLARSTPGPLRLVVQHRAAPLWRDVVVSRLGGCTCRMQSRSS